MSVTWQSDICEYCGRDLNKLGEYRDYVHYRVDYPSVPCLEDHSRQDSETFLEWVLRVISAVMAAKE